jgi:hypothetical protein
MRKTVKKRLRNGFCLSLTAAAVLKRISSHPAETAVFRDESFPYVCPEPVLAK